MMLQLNEVLQSAYQRKRHYYNFLNSFLAQLVSKLRNSCGTVILMGKILYIFCHVLCLMGVLSNS